MNNIRFLAMSRLASRIFAKGKALVFWSIFCLANLDLAWGQGLEITKFIPGNYLTDNNHLVELTNRSGYVIHLEGFLLITRDYAFRFSKNVVLRPGQILKIGKKKGKPHNVDFELIEQPDFAIRLYNKKVEGNYCALQNALGQTIDAFYHSQLAATPILPDSGLLMLHNGAVQPYRLLSENNPIWGYFPIGEDPAIGFEKYKGKWRVIPALSSINLYPATAYSSVSARYIKNAVTLKWQTAFEDNVAAFLVQRSANQVEFATIDTVESLGGPKKPGSYVFYDLDVLPNQTYYYRVVNLAVQDEKNVFSKIVEVQTLELPVEFWMELFPLEASPNQSFSLRFATAYSQYIKIKVLDSERRERAILFYDWVFADIQNLLRFELSDAPAGEYLLIAAAEEKRYFQKFFVINP